jgi:hypothetical protein
MPLVLTPEIKELVNNGLTSGNPLVLAVVDGDNKPSLSFRGSTQVHSDDQLGLWIRNTSGGTIEAIKKNPHVALMYRSTATPLLQFQGRARVVTDEAERTSVYDRAPERERAGDPDKKGIAVIIDLDKVAGVLSFGKDGPVFANLER